MAISARDRVRAVGRPGSSRRLRTQWITAKNPALQLEQDAQPVQAGDPKTRTVVGSRPICKNNVRRPAHSMGRKAQQREKARY
jgi:hypothetical protein